MLSVGGGLPIAVWPFLASAYDLVANGRNMAVQPFLQRVAQLQPIPLSQPEAALAPYQRWLQTQTMRAMRALWETTFGTIALRHSVIHYIDATIELFRGNNRPQTSLALRLPIHSGDAFAAAVWMDLIVRLAKWDRTVLNAFWTPQHDLMVHVGPPQPGTFRELLSCGTDAEHVTDLIHVQHLDEATARSRLNPQVAAAVDDSGKTIHAFLRAI
jgi:type VI secretion system protein ImpM